MADQPIDAVPDMQGLPHYIRLKPEHGGTVYPRCMNVRVEPRAQQTIVERRNLVIPAGFDVVFTTGVSEYLPAEQRVDADAIQLLIPPVDGFPVLAEGEFAPENDDQTVELAAERDRLLARIAELETQAKSAPKTAPRARTRAARSPVGAGG